MLRTDTYALVSKVTNTHLNIRGTESKQPDPREAMEARLFVQLATLYLSRLFCYYSQEFRPDLVDKLSVVPVCLHLPTPVIDEPISYLMSMQNLPAAMRA